MTDELLTAAEAAQRLGFAVSQVTALCREGKLPARKIGRDWLIRPADLAGVTRGVGGWPKGRPRKPEP